jgi:two-component system sensor histidine kinase HydH
MIQEVDRLNRVITQLLEFARPVTLSPKTVPAHPLIRTSMQLVAREAERRGVRIEAVLSARVATVRIDPDRIHQVLLNLYLNAIEAMDDGGTMSVALEPGLQQGAYTIRVSDNGSGIPEDVLQQVFDPYFTTKASGTGLGLAIVHNIVEALAGQVRIENRPQGGTIVTLTLPGHVADNAETDKLPSGRNHDGKAEDSGGR